MRLQCVLGCQLDGDLPGQVRAQAAVDIDQRELLKLGIGCFRQLARFAGNVGFLGIGLRTHRDVLAGGHGHCARDQAGRPRNKDVGLGGSRGGDADDQAGGGDNAVIGAEDGRPQPADPGDSVSLDMGA